MAKIELNPWYFNKNQRAEQEEDHRTLLALRYQLAGLPAEAIHRPLGDVFAYVGAARQLARDAHGAGASSDEQLANVEALSRALRAAQLAHLYKPHPEEADPGLVCFVDTQLALLEGDADALVRAGRLQLDELPRAPGSTAQDRCAWGVALVAFFLEHGLRSRAGLRKLASLLPKIAPFMIETTVLSSSP